MRFSYSELGWRALTAVALAAPLLSQAQAPQAARAAAYLQTQAPALGLTAADVRDPAVTSQYTDEPSGVTHCYLAQRYQGVAVHGAVADVHLDRTGRVVAAHQNFVPNLATAVRGTTASLTAVQAVAAAARAVQAPAPKGVQLLNTTPGTGLRFAGGTLSRTDIPVTLVYQPQADGLVRLAWEVTLYPVGSSHYWNLRLDAQTGQVLDQQDYMIAEPVPFGQLGNAALPAAGALPAPAPGSAQRSGVPNSYNVWPLTLESPLSGARAVVANPAHPIASPFGWHDTTGTAGPEFTTTRGNNVAAYEDRANRDTSYLSHSPDGGPTLDFDFPYVAGATSLANQDAAITNLFYWNNLMHDVMHRHGFNEPAGNFQANNYGRGGRRKDAVQAEAQDGSGLNNANFGTPPDGEPPYMQMYLWSSGQPLAVTAPAAIAGSYGGSEAAFGANLELVGPVTGTVVAALSSTGRPLKGCGPAANAAALSGNIALVDRGNCTFKTKALQAQLAGARMLIIADTTASTTPIAPGNDPTVTAAITIPVLAVTRATGLLLRNTPGPVTIAASAVRRDGDFDNGIVAHEYGHGISTRLTGGPANANCLNNREQMGEGWSDFFGLWMTTKPTDVGATPRGIGNFATSQAATAGGIRTKPYTTNFAINDLTYANLGTAAYSEVHRIGEIWCAALWDLDWALIARHGYNADLYGTTGGNNLCLRLVLDGCKLQPCSPGFLDGRNAILKADSLNNNAANSALIWQVFARRGMGFSARQGSSAVLTDGTAGFDLPPRLLATAGALAHAQLDVYPNPANEQLTVRTQVGSATAVRVELLDVLGRVVLAHEVSAARLQQQGEVLDVAALPAGMYVLRVSTSAGRITRHVSVLH